jgi:hypothetical protein
VISEAAGEQRKTTAPATSSGSPIRCSAAIRALEVRDRHLLGGDVTHPAAGVVDEQVERPQLLHGRRDGRLDLVEASDVHLQRHGTTAVGANLVRESVVA